MPVHPTSNNRLLSALAPEDLALLAPRLERVALPFSSVLIAPHEPIGRVFFPEGGLVSTIAEGEDGRVEVGVVGREGLVGLPALLGADRTPHASLVQVEGQALAIAPAHLQAALRARPSLFRPLGLYAHAFMVQVAGSAYSGALLAIEARLARWLLMVMDRLGPGEMALTHDFLATMLGVRRPGVTVAVHVLEGTGAIRARRGRIEVRDRGRLLELAGDAYGGPEAEYERLMGEA